MPDNLPRELYPADVVSIYLTCAACGHAWESSLPVLVDWRDRAALDRLEETFPAVGCVACGAAVVTDRPVVLLRPGDPVAVLVSVAGRGAKSTDLLSELLTRHAVSPVVGAVGYVPFIEPESLFLVADRYTGFALLGVDDPLGDLRDVVELVPWLEALLGSIGVDALSPLQDFMNAGDEDEARRLFTESRVLSGGAWLPALRRKTPELESQQDSDEGRAGIRGRVSLLGKLVTAGPSYVPDQGAAGRYLHVLQQLTDLITASDRTAERVALAVRRGRELVELSTAAWGPSDAITLTAVNDAAAAMMDDPALVGEAQTLLREAQQTAADAQRPVLADITTNLGISRLRNNRVPNADDLDRAVGFLKDAVHLYRVLEPDRPEKSTTTLINLAALVRSSLTRTEDINVEESVALLAEIDTLIIGSSREFGVLDEVTRRANELNTLATQVALNPTPDGYAQMVAAIDALDPMVAELHDGHPARLRSLTNLGSIACDHLGRLPESLAIGLKERAAQWLDAAIRESADLAPDDALRVLPRMTFAALQFQHGGPEKVADALAMLMDCAAGLVDTASTPLHLTVFNNLAQAHIACSQYDEAIEALTNATGHAEEMIRTAATPATRLAQIAAAGDVFQRLAFLHVMKKDARSAIHTVERSRARWRAADPVEDMDGHELDLAVKAALEPKAGLLYVGTCNLGTYAVILTGASGAGAFVVTPRSSDLQPAVAQLAAGSSPDDIDAALGVAADLLGEPVIRQVVGIAKLAQLQRLLIVAGGLLSALPLASIPSSEGRLADQVEVRYLVSIRGRPDADRRSQLTHAVGIADPTRDLTFAPSELVALSRYLPTLIPPEGRGIKSWLLEYAAEASHLHLACHAETNLVDPFSSRFILGENLGLTVEDLAQNDLSSLDLVVATACKSGAVDPRTSDEQVGLAAALIAAGAGAVVASLWDLGDLASAIVIARFYDELANGEPPSLALQAAQRWVETATTRNVLTALAPSTWLPEELHRELRGLLLHPDNRSLEARPFRRPAHWAGLLYVS